MAKYLDNIGLDVLWKKIKSLIPTIATSSKAGTIKSGGDIEINSEGVVTVKQADDLKTDKYLNKENSTQQSMKTKTIVTNLNADLIDGYHSIEQFKLGNCNPESKGPAFGKGAYSGSSSSIVIGQGSYSPDRVGDTGAYNNILGASVAQEKKSYYPVEFTVGDSLDVVYATHISKLEELTINFKEMNTNIINDTTYDCILVILPVELFYQSEKYTTITAGGENQFDISIIYSGLNPQSKAQIRKQEKIIVNDTIYTILLLTDYLDTLPINFNLIASDTQFKCTGVDDVVGGYAAIVGYGSSGNSFSAILGRNNHGEYQSCAIGRGNKLFGSSSVGIGAHNLSSAGNVYLLGLYNQGISNGGIGIGQYLNVTYVGCIIGRYNDTSINSMYWSQFAIGAGTSESNRRTVFHVFLSSTDDEFYLGSGKEDKNIKLIFNTKNNSSTNYNIFYNKINKWLESRIGGSTTSIFPTSGGMFDPSTGDMRTLMRYKDVMNITSPINEALNNKVDKSEINQPLEFDVTYNLGNASTENTEYVKLFSVNDGYAVELLMAIEGPFGTYTLEKCVANCAYYPSVTTDTTKLYYQQKLFNVNHVNILMKLPPKGQFYPDQKIRLKLLKAFRRDNTTVTDIYSAITWGEGIKLTNITAIEGQTLKYFPTISRPTSLSSIINLNQNDINNSKVDIDCTTSTSWFIKSDIADSIDSLFTINSSAFPAAGTAIDFIFDVDFKNGINLALSDSIVATYSEPLYKGDKLTFIVPESNDRWYIKLTPVSIVSNSLSVDIDNSGRTNLEVIPISDEKIVACCVL